MKKISVVLPVYNGEQYLAEAIESVLKQTYENLQLIIVDDCSSDNTFAIAEEYAQKDKRVLVVRNEKNLKLPASLNVGFRYADGEYFTWTSDDNMYMPRAIAAMANFLEENTAYGMVYCDMTLIDENGKTLRENILPEPEQLVFGNTIGACFLYRSTILAQLGEYDENLFLAEDYDYWLRIYQEYPIKHLKQSQYYYRYHEKSLSGTQRDRVKLQTCKAWDKHFTFIREHISGQETFCNFLDMYVEFQGEQRRKAIKKFAKEYSFYRKHLLVKKIKFIFRVMIRKICLMRKR